MTKKPPSEKRAAANRANAAKSTGPRTPEGKTRAAQNARKHGFTASKFIVVKLEELDSLANLRDDAVAAYQPQNSQELFAVERIALAQHALLRCAALEAGLFSDAMNQIIAFEDGTPNTIVSDALHDGIDATTAQNRSLCVAKGFQLTSRRDDAWKLFLRYQAQTERLYRRAIEEFERLKALRTELPQTNPIPPPKSRNSSSSKGLPAFDTTGISTPISPSTPCPPPNRRAPAPP